MHRLTVYATKEGIQAETFVYFKIVQTLVKVGLNMRIIT